MWVRISGPAGIVGGGGVSSFNTTTEVSLSKTPNPLLPGHFFLSHTRLYREYITSSEMYSLHLTHPKWTHTRSSGQPCYSARGAVGGSVPCSRTPQSWYWRRREHWLFTPPTNNPCRITTNPQPLDYKSDSLSIRPRLPPTWLPTAPGVCSLRMG